MKSIPWLLLLAIAVGVPFDMIRVQEMLDVFARTIQALLLGEPPEEMAFQVAPETLLTPLSAETLQRVRACRELRRAEVQVEYASRWWFFRRGHLRVRYDVEGVTEEGEVVTVQEQALLKVDYIRPGRYGTGTPIVQAVTLLTDA